MKTHDLARGLEQLAFFLRNQRNVDTKTLELIVEEQKELDSADIVVNLTTLAALSRIDKQQWLRFILENNLPIEIPKRDSTRDIIGKLMRYLDENRDAQKRLLNKSRHGRQQVSSELMKALDLLMSE